MLILRTSHRRPSWLPRSVVLLLLAIGAAVFAVPSTLGQPQRAPDAETKAAELQALVERLQSDPRGPFQALRWFCPDGSVRPPQARCAQPGGKQHGLLKDEVLRLQRTHHLFLDPVLTGTPFDAFWDASHRQSRLKQYLLQRYLFAADDGWIMRRAQYYRGALQAEDEAEWSRNFLIWLLQDDDRLSSHFYLVREVVRGLPLAAESDLQQRIRALSKEISEAHPPFLDLRVKIHGRPDSTDLVRVQEFRQQHGDALSSTLRDQLDTLERLLREAYAVAPEEQIRDLSERLTASTALAQRLAAYLDRVEGSEPSEFVARSAELLWHLRIELTSLPPDQRLAALQVSVALEDGILRSATRWQPTTLAGLTEKIHALAQAAAGAGFLEIWEWSHIESQLRPPDGKSLALAQLRQHAQRARRVADWGAGTVFSTYEPVVDTYEAFEPLARGFLDDRIRASVLLPLGDAVGHLSGLYAEEAGTPNDVFGLAEGQRAQGVNPGVAVGTLKVVPGSAEGMTVSPDNIYVFRQPPTDLKPVAGIASVMEGNVVSHVQLLARNLGIPNATIPPSLVDRLQKYEGERVFYAVSPGGAVVMKPARAMTAAEQSLVQSQTRSEDRVRAPTDRIDLDMQHPVPLDSVRATDSGRICGPKAATMGELEGLFPQRVTDGLVVPFGVFRRHMEQSMPGTEGSYWAFVQSTFREAERRRSNGVSPTSIAAYVTGRLQQLQDAVRAMPLRAEFVTELRRRFTTVFGEGLGQVPVFVRSDTNMEDLKDFTGAGLNLTVPNVVDESALLDAIRDVWASAYSDRSYQWRQRLLMNPEDIYPSVLLQRSVDVEASGVLLTIGLADGGAEDVTVAFNRGVGGAVEGQAAETWLLRATGTDELLTPAREPTYRVLSDQAGVAERFTSFERPILSPQRRATLRSVATEVRVRLPALPGIDSGPYDVELGFVNERLWLFQARPFVENRRLRSAEYLRSLDRRTQDSGRVSLSRPLQQ